MKYSDLSEKTPFYILLLPWIVSLIIFSFIIAYLAILNDYDAKIIILCQLLIIILQTQKQIKKKLSIIY